VAGTVGSASVTSEKEATLTKGPGTHSHEADDVFFVIKGTMSFLISSD
jgi:hypothetical protein